MRDPQMFTDDQEIVKQVEEGISSTQAAALFLSEGRTTDPNEAAALAYAGGEALNMDGLQRAHLRRMMGFDFKVKVRGNKLLVSSKEGPRVRTHAKILPGELDDRGNIIKPELIDRLVEACIRLKTKWEEKL